MQERPLLLEQAARWCTSRFRENKLPFLFSFVIGLACYMFALTNKLVNHDEVQSLFMKGGTVTSGRWGLGLLDSIFPNYSMPWIYGLMAIALMSAAVCVMIRCLSLDNSALKLVFAGSVIAFPSLIGTFGYMFTVNSFALAFLLCVVSVRLLLEKHPFCKVLALGFLIFSLSIYQSYISVAAGLLVLILIRRLLNREDMADIIRTGVGYVLFLGAALGIYYGLTNVFLRLLGLELNEYASGNMGFSFARIPASILEAYRSFFRFFGEGYLRLIPTGFSRLLHGICLAAALLLLVLHCVRIRSLPHCLLLLALTCILPLAINCMYLFTTVDSIHTLVMYGFVGFYGFAALLADHSLARPASRKILVHTGRAAVNLFSVALALIIVCNCYVANAAFLNLHLRYENAYAFYTSLLSDIKALPEFGPDSAIALIGTYQDPEFYNEQFDFAGSLTGVTGFKPDSYSRQRFMEYYIGTELPFADESTIAALTQLPAVQSMPVYPYYGSIRVIDSFIVVKLS